MTGRTKPAAGGLRGALEGAPGASGERFLLPEELAELQRVRQGPPGRGVPGPEAAAGRLAAPRARLERRAPGALAGLDLEGGGGSQQAEEVLERLVDRARARYGLPRDPSAGGRLGAAQKPLGEPSVLEALAEVRRRIRDLPVRPPDGEAEVAARYAPYALQAADPLALHDGRLGACSVLANATVQQLLDRRRLGYGAAGAARSCFCLDRDGGTHQVGDVLASLARHCAIAAPVLGRGGGDDVCVVGWVGLWEILGSMSCRVVERVREGCGPDEEVDWVREVREHQLGGLAQLYDRLQLAGAWRAFPSVSPATNLKDLVWRGFYGVPAPEKGARHPWPSRRKAFHRAVAAWDSGGPGEPGPLPRDLVSETDVVVWLSFCMLEMGDLPWKTVAMLTEEYGLVDRSRKVFTVAPETPVVFALSEMFRRDQPIAAVVDGGELVGTFSVKALRFVTPEYVTCLALPVGALLSCVQQRPVGNFNCKPDSFAGLRGLWQSHQRFGRSFMSAGAAAVRESSEFQKVLDIICAQREACVWVTSAEGQVVGSITTSDILQCIASYAPPPLSLGGT